MAKASSKSAPLSVEQVDAVMIGGGVASATLAALLNYLEPSWNILVLEQFSATATESSAGWNNAGTGHSALCELNYTPQNPDGTISIEKAVYVNEQFQLSRQFWASLVKAGILGQPQDFIRSVPHMSFVQGSKDSAFLKARFEALKDHPLFV